MLTPVYCVHCKQQIDPTDRFCRSCGGEQRSSFSETPVQTLQETPLCSPVELACIVCGNPGVQKVSAIYQAGTWSSQSTGSFGGVAYAGNGHYIPVGGGTRTSSQGTTQIAQSLAPPAQPHYKNTFLISLWEICLALLIGLGIIALLLGENAWKPPVFPYMIGVMAIPVLTFAIPIGTAKRTARHRVAQDMIVWQQAMNNWNRLFYCSRCDCVYDPQLQRSAPVAQMPRLLL